MRRFRSDLILLLVAIIWGTGFVSQRAVASDLGIFIFNAGRFLIGALLLAPFALQKHRRHDLLNSNSLVWVVLTGLALFGASYFQQAGIRTTTTANAAFITGLYVVLVPILLSLAWRQHIPMLSWVAALLAVAGIWLLSARGRWQIAPGDALEMVGAFLWALHVILIGRLAPRMDVFRLAAGQFLVAGLLHLAFGLGLESSTVPALSQTWWAVLYNGVFSVAIGFTLQVIGQKEAPPTDAAILLSMEAVFAALFGYLLLGESLLPLQVTGCGLIFAAMLLSQARRNAVGSVTRPGLRRFRQAKTKEEDKQAGQGEG